MQKYDLQKNSSKRQQILFEVGLALEASQKMKEASIIEKTHSFIHHASSEFTQLQLRGRRDKRHGLISVGCSISGRS
jgi:hypothetical protein